MGETNYHSVAHVGYDISPLSRAKFNILTTSLAGCSNKFIFSSLEWRNIVTHGQLKEKLCIHNLVGFIYKQQCIYTDENTRPYWLEAIHLDRPFLHMYTTIGDVLTCFRHNSSCSSQMVCVILFFMFYFCPIYTKILRNNNNTIFFLEIFFLSTRQKKR